MTTSTKLKILAWGVALSALLVMPLEILHGLMWLAAHVFELFEFVLDEIIHHVFHTSRYTTQLIVFYLMLALLLLALYGLFRWARGSYYRLKAELPQQWSQQKQQAADYWQNLPRRQKFKMISAMTLGGACFAFLTLN